MERALLLIGRLSGLAGVLIVVFAFGARLGGFFFVGRFQIGTVLQAGIAIMLIGCVAYLEVAARRLIAER